LRVVLTAEAQADLDQIADHIALDSPARALSFVGELVAAAREIGAMPRAYPLVKRYAHLEIRRRVHGAYLIFFRADADRVLIVHIVHGARDYEALLFPES
jgi:plasmid stabilization system protein ParE